MRFSFLELRHDTRGAGRPVLAVGQVNAGATECMLCIVVVDGIVGPSALALWLLYIYIGLAVPANSSIV